MIRARTSIFVSLAAAMALTACAEGQTFGEGNPNRNTNSGVLLGALGGAAAGRIIGGNNDDSTKNALAGAAVGAIAGGLIGNQLDKQEAELRQQLGNNVSINNTGDRLVVTMPQDILFPFDSAALRSDLQADIRTVGRSLLQYPNTTVQVLGHTDSDGDASYNQKLSLRRAQAVSSVLVAEGVPSSRIQSIGRGEDQPIASNLTAEGKQQNRRVEIVILPNS
ncbi:OmpA family protein [Salipiger thiooxidans]|jgi:outer membrane protein OmpA-like peptidoglycan-associated protein|uniref:OmpA family protein n=1 Tax=Salipiger thiooxidans TaxID=282683 RepID=UPI001A8F5698|nr:OmpA family protein [Salipiger thiooxidans]MBN8185200.1 OmpA family protein [Salipiger thiooxidans]MBR9837426.1 OmpA family protein [Paracoccaceae bacterium]